MLLVARDLAGIPFNQWKTPVYLQSWLTQIAGRDNLIKTTIVENGEQIASLSIALARNVLGMKHGSILPWARLCGPVISGAVSNEKRASIARRLVRLLPKDVSYWLPVDECDIEPFLSEGFKPASEDNYFILPDQLPVLYASFSKMTRRHIKQAQRNQIVSTTTPAAFIDIYASDLLRRGRTPYSPLAIAHDILAEGLRRGQAHIFTAERRDTGEIDAAIACLWDDERYYYWMTTRRVQVDGESKPEQGAVKLLLWSAIQDAATRGLIFDFDGAGTDIGRAGRAKLYDGMGAQQCVRYVVRRETDFQRFVNHFLQPIKRAIRDVDIRIFRATDSLPLKQ
jgi:Acetyltransferase (GNAT) domain